MKMRLLFATEDVATRELMHSLLDSALELVPLDIEVAEVTMRGELVERAERHADDLILLDWPLAAAETPNLIHTLLRANPKLRVVVLLPLSHRQYRRPVWEAGACNSIPKEHMDQEWLSSVLCVMNRAMTREARLIARHDAEIESMLASAPKGY